MHKILSIPILLSYISLSGCATSLLSSALPNETTHVQTTTLKTDQIIAMGQATQSKNKQDFTFIGQDYNYLITDSTSNFLKIIQNIPSEQITIKSPTPLVFEMDDSSHFHGEITIRYNSPTIKIDEKQKELLNTLGFKNHFMAMENQQQVFYPFTTIRFKGEIYERTDKQKIHQKLSIPYAIALQQKSEISKKHPIKRATRMILSPLAMTFDVITIAPSFIWSDLHGEFTK